MKAKKTKYNERNRHLVPPALLLHCQHCSFSWPVYDVSWSWQQILLQERYQVRHMRLEPWLRGRGWVQRGAVPQLQVCGLVQICFVFLQRYFGPPKPADAEALDLLQSECPHLYDELTAAGEVSNVNKLYEIFQLHRWTFAAAQDSWGTCSRTLLGSAPSSPPLVQPVGTTSARTTATWPALRTRLPLLKPTALLRDLALMAMKIKWWRWWEVSPTMPTLLS